MRAATKRYRLRGPEMEDAFGLVEGRRSSGLVTWDADSREVLTALFGHRQSDSLTSAIKQNPFVMAAWKSLARNISGIPIRVYKGDRMNRKPSDWVGANHPLQVLMDKPSPAHIRANFWSVVVAHMLEHGQSPWMISGADMKPRASKTETPGAIFPLSPRTTLGEVAPGAWLPQKYRTTLNGRTIDLLPHQIVRVFEADPDDPIGFRAISPLVAGWVDLATDFAAGRWSQDFFKNGAMPAGILKAKSRLIESKVRQMRASWEAQHGGTGKQHRVAILDDGTEYQALSTSAREMELLNLRGWGITIVSAITGVPKKELALTEDMNHATALSMDRQYWTRTLIPMIRMFEDFMHCEVFRWIEGGRYYVAWDLSAVPALREDMAAQLDALAKMRDLGIRARDARSAVGLDLPSQGEVDDLQFIPANLTLVEDFLAPAEEPPMDDEVVAGSEDGSVANDEDSTESESDGDEGADGAADEDAETPKRGINPDPAAQSSSPRDRALSPRARLKAAAERVRAKKAKRARRLFNRFDQQVRRKGSKRIGDKVGKWMAKMRRSVIARAEKLAEAQGFQRSSQGESYIRALGSKLIEWRLTEADVLALVGDLAGWDDALRSISRGTYESIVKAVGGFLEEELGSPFSLDITDPKWTRIIATSRGRLVKEVSEPTRLAVRDALLEVARAGGTILDVQKSMQELSQFGRDRANRIAWTETAMTASDARNQGHIEAGVARHEWVNDGGVNVREAHQNGSGVGGEIVRIGEPFSNGMLYPLGPMSDGSVAPPEEVVNCNCQPLAVLD